MAVALTRTPGQSLRHGFSLLEATLALAILATLATIGAPRYVRSLERYRLDVAARRVELDIALARKQAMALSAPVTITFSVDPAPSLYSIPALEDPDHPGALYTVRLEDEPYGVRISSASFGGDAALSFNGHAIPDDGGQVVLALGEGERIVTVDSATNMDPVD